MRSNGAKSERVCSIFAPSSGANAESAKENFSRHVSILCLYEPGFDVPARHPDDPVCFPIYEVCARLGVPVFLMSGLTTPDLRFNDPAPLTRVAQAFPTLPIVCYHGYWPNAEQLIGGAFRYENIHVVPATCICSCRAARPTWRPPTAFSPTCFCSARPTLSGRSARASTIFLPLGFSEAVLDTLLYGNAARLQPSGALLFGQAFSDA